MKSADEWRTATTQRILVQSSRTPGEIRGPASRAPAGTWHTYLPGRRETPCGTHLLELELWPEQPFAPPAGVARCPQCIDAVARSRAAMTA